MDINYLVLYLISFGWFILFDAVWLGLIAKKLYATELKGLMTDDVKWAVAGLFYLIFVAGLVYFVIAPTIKSGSMNHLLLSGAAFGLVTYATYDLTNYATLKGFSPKIVVIDLIWGTFLSMAVAGLSYLTYTKFIN